MDTVNKLVIYQAADGAIELPVDAKLETIWATQKQIAEVFGVNVRTVNEHLGNIFDTDELDRDSVIRNFRITASDGKTYDTKHYNLDAIISVGYRVNSKNATHFRKWATATLKQYITSGFVIDKKRVEHNLSQFTRALNDLKLLSENVEQVGSSEATDLALAFAATWLSLDAYDKSELPSSGTIKKAVDIGAGELEAELHKLRKALIAKGEATDIFATERTKGGLTIPAWARPAISLSTTCKTRRWPNRRPTAWMFTCLNRTRQMTISTAVGWLWLASRITNSKGAMTVSRGRW